MSLKVKTVNQIIEDAVTYLIGIGSQITDFNAGTPQREILKSVAIELQREYYVLWLLYNGAFLDTAEGDYLDKLVKILGLSRRTANPASGHLTFYGDVDTIIPGGTKVASTDGLYYSTMIEGAINPSGHIEIPAVCETTGPDTNKPIGKINVLLQPITGVSSVTNNEPFTGGRDEETDLELRKRALTRASTVALLSKDAMEQMVIEGANSFCFDKYTDPWTPIICQNDVPGVNMLRAKAERVASSKMKIHLVGIAGDSIPLGLQHFVERYLEARLPVTLLIEVQPVQFVNVDITATIYLEEGNLPDTVEERIIQNLSSFLDWTVWEWGEEVVIDDLIAVIVQTPGVHDLSLNAPQNDVPVGEFQLPKLGVTNFTYVYLS